MRKRFLFLWLYVYAVINHIRHIRRIRPIGQSASAVTIFHDIYRDPKRSHGVAVFVFSRGESLDSNYTKDLYGPFGYSSEIDWNGYHLYGVDSWGSLDPSNLSDAAQIAGNKVLASLVDQNPGCTLQLAGVRRIFGRHVWPLNITKHHIFVRR